MADRQDFQSFLCWDCSGAVLDDSATKGAFTQAGVDDTVEADQ